MCETGESAGRNEQFREPFLGDKRTNLLVEDEQTKLLPAVASTNDLVFFLRNYNIWSLGIGHTKYRDILSHILEYIQFRI